MRESARNHCLTPTHSLFSQLCVICLGSVQHCGCVHVCASAGVSGWLSQAAAQVLEGFAGQGHCTHACKPLREGLPAVKQLRHDEVQQRPQLLQAKATQILWELWLQQPLQRCACFVACLLAMYSTCSHNRHAWPGQPRSHSTAPVSTKQRIKATDGHR